MNSSSYLSQIHETSKLNHPLAESTTIGSPLLSEKHDNFRGYVINQTYLNLFHHLMKIITGNVELFPLCLILVNIDLHQASLSTNSK